MRRRYFSPHPRTELFFYFQLPLLISHFLCFRWLKCFLGCAFCWNLLVQSWIFRFLIPRKMLCFPLCMTFLRNLTYLLVCWQTRAYFLMFWQPACILVRCCLLPGNSLFSLVLFVEIMFLLMFYRTLFARQSALIVRVSQVRPDFVDGDLIPIFKK